MIHGPNVSHQYAFLMEKRKAELIAQHSATCSYEQITDMLMEFRDSVVHGTITNLEELYELYKYNN